MLALSSPPLKQFPVADRPYWLPVSPLYARCQLWQRAFMVAILLLFLAISLWSPWPLPSPLFWFAWSLAALWTLYLPVAFVRERRLAYALCQHELYSCAGLFWQQQICQPLRPVQHVSLEQGPLDKLFGLATLSLFSAGSPSASLRLPGLPMALAEQYRQIVLDYKRGHHDANA